MIGYYELDTKNVDDNIASVKIYFKGSCRIITHQLKEDG